MRSRKWFALALLALVATLSLGCEEVPQAVEITGSTSINTTDGAVYTGTATGGFPIVGSVIFSWYFDDNDDDRMQDSEVRYKETVTPDEDGTAVSSVRYTPATSDIGKQVTLEVFAGFLSPGSNDISYQHDEHTLTVTE